MPKKYLINRKSLAKYLVAKLQNNSYDDKTMALIIRSIHLHIPFYIIYVLVHCNTYILKILYICLFFSLILFYLLNACILTLIEKEFDNESDFVVIDLLMNPLGLDKTYRMKVSILVFCLYGVLILYIANYRHRRTKLFTGKLFNAYYDQLN